MKQATAQMVSSLIPVALIAGAMALILFVVVPDMNNKLAVSAQQKWCIDVYSGGVGIGAFKGYRPSVVSSDGSMLFQDDVKGEIRIRGDWILEKCE